MCVLKGICLWTSIITEWADTDSCIRGCSLLSLVHVITQSLLLYRELLLIWLDSLSPAEILKACVRTSACHPACITTRELVLPIVFACWHGHTAWNEWFKLDLILPRPSAGNETEINKWNHCFTYYVQHAHLNGISFFFKLTRPDINTHPADKIRKDAANKVLKYPTEQFQPFYL